MESYESLCSQLEKLRYENAELRIMLDIVKENYDLQAKLSTQQTNDETVGNTGRKTTLRWQDTLDEGRFSSDLQRVPRKTSSPVSLKAVEKGSSQRSTIQKEQFADNSNMPQERKLPTDSKKLERLVGEIAFQLDRRILFHVFPGQARLYGFTVLNIHEKIIQVSRQPLTGKVDEAYRYQLSQRHMELMEKLHTLGYITTLHAPFAEYVVNTYGILKQRPDPLSAEELGYNNPEFLRSIIIKIVPAKLLKDMLCLFSCLCFMARQDGKPLFLW